MRALGIGLCAAAVWSGSLGRATAQQRPLLASDPKARSALFHDAVGPAGAKATGFDPKHTNRVEGRVVRATHGDLLLERAFEPARLADLERMGFRVIDSMNRVADRTILGTNAYIMYSTKRSDWSGIKPRELEGKLVTLEVGHDSRGFPLVVSIKPKS
jgi:hypothetical protein